MMNHSCEIETEHKLIVVKFSQLLVFLCILNAVSAILTTVANSLVLTAIWKTPSLRSPSYVLLSGLALSDLGVGLVAQPIFVCLNVALHQGNCHLFSRILIIHNYVAHMLLAMTFSTLCIVAFDRLLAVTLHLRYQELVTVCRILLLLSSMWTLAGASTVWVSTHPSSGKIFQAVCIVLFLVFTLGVYFKIFQIVRHHQFHIQNQAPTPQLNARQTMPNIARFKKSVVSMLYIVGLFLISYLPWVCFHLVNETRENKDIVDIIFAGKVLFTVTYLNSCFNPFLYCWRMKEIRLAVRETMKALLIF